jgi:DNA-binding GntR family transcriptional regulator
LTLAGEPAGILGGCCVSGTIAEQVYEHLVGQIIAGEIRPGQRVEEQAVASQFGVSRTPVRDALRQLAGTGLVRFRPNRGVTVVDLNLDELIEVFEALGEFEALCAKLAAQRMTQLERRALETLHTEAAEVVKTQNEPRFFELSNQMHQTIYRGAHNQSIATITENFRQRLMPFRSSAGIATHRMLASQDEHAEVVAAIVPGDAARAYDAMRSHVARSSLTVLNILKERGQQNKRLA